jgi:pimeloyl-ACP methyl ester carboxylesterase
MLEGQQLESIVERAMASGNDAQFAVLQRARRLRSVLGVPSPEGFCLVDGSPIVWQRFRTAIDSGATVETVVCLHDAGSGSREFHPLVSHIPIGSQLLMLDWPGHGHSAEPVERPEFSVERCSSLLSGVLHQLGIRQPILLGSGFGAAVAIRYAADHPTGVKGLVLCQPAGLVSSSLPSSSPTRKANCAPASKINGPARKQALRLEVVKPALRSLCEEADLSLRQSETGLRSALKGLRYPVLFALSRESRAYLLQKYLDLLDPLLKSAPQHRFTVFTGGFNPIWDEPERFAQALTGFIQAQLPLSRHCHAWLLSAVDWPTRTMNLWKCVHPECPAEQVLPEGQNPNDASQ